jgi:23S rRNA (uracil1939-C5)-methyltransferase
MTEETVCAPVPPPHAPDAPAESPALPAGWLKVDSLDIEAQGIARKPDGKVVFIEGALPFEVVSVNVHRKKNNWEAGTVTAIHQESSQRVRPGCPHFGLHTGACGGCKMQHLHAAAQVAVKQRVLEDNLWHLAKVRAETLLRPIEGPTWGYRYRARLSVRYVHKKGEVLVGFHERKSRYVADIRECPVLPPHVDAMLMPLRALIFSLDARETCPQIELAGGDDVTALVLRHLEPLSEGDLARLRTFAVQYDVQWWLQPKGPDTVHLLDEGGTTLAYALPDFGISMPFKPPTSRRSTRTSTACWCRARCACWRWKGTSASSTGSAAWATSRCRWPRRRARCSASRAARPWWPAPGRIMRKTRPIPAHFGHCVLLSL